MKAAIYSQKKDLDTFLYLSKFISELENRGVKSVLFDEMAEALQFSKIFETFNCKQDLLDKEIDLFFTFGGDGTIVNSLTFIENLEIPIVGVNTGRLGFLASFTKEEASNQLIKFIKKVEEYDYNSKNLDVNYKMKRPDKVGAFFISFCLLCKIFY